MTSSYQGVFFESAAVRSNEVTGLKSRSLETSKPVVPLHTYHKKTPQSKWSYLVPVLCVTALGSAFIPYFTLGLAVGVIAPIAELAIILAIAIPTFLLLWMVKGQSWLDNELEKDSENKKDYRDSCAKDPVGTALWYPIKEEILFRFILQHLLICIGTLLAPALAVTPFFATGLSAVSAASIACASVFFGLAHLSNSKNNDSYGQATLCTINGVIYGVMAINFGLGAPIAAHIANNTFCVTLSKLLEEIEINKPSEDEVEVSPSMAFSS